MLFHFFPVAFWSISFVHLAEICHHVTSISLHIIWSHGRKGVTQNMLQKICFTHRSGRVTWMNIVPCNNWSSLKGITWLVWFDFTTLAKIVQIDKYLPYSWNIHILRDMHGKCLWKVCLVLLNKRELACCEIQHGMCPILY